MNYWIIFLTGLAVGGFTCIALQGGLLASAIAARNENKTILPTLMFLISKLAAYTFLGFLLGLFGSTFQISDTLRIFIQVVTGLYIIVVALSLLNVHPVFRYALIQPPRFLIKKIKSKSKSSDLFTPALLGFMTVFIPCGTTLAMETLAISSGKPLLGAITMFIFVLGTTPMFLGIGFLTTKLRDLSGGRFFKFAAVILVYLGISTIKGGLNLAGFSFSFRKPAQTVQNFSPLYGTAQEFDVQVTSYGYFPGRLTVKAGEPVKLNLITENNYSCSSVFKIPKLNITKILPPTGKEVVEFTPKKKGRLVFTCSMGMFVGVISVI